MQNIYNQMTIYWNLLYTIFLTIWDDNRIVFVRNRTHELYDHVIYVTCIGLRAYVADKFITHRIHTYSDNCKVE